MLTCAREGKGHLERIIDRMSGDAVAFTFSLGGQTLGELFFKPLYRLFSVARGGWLAEIHI